MIVCSVTFYESLLYSFELTLSGLHSCLAPVWAEVIIDANSCDPVWLPTLILAPPPKYNNNPGSERELGFWFDTGIVRSCCQSNTKVKCA